MAAFKGWLRLMIVPAFNVSWSGAGVGRVSGGSATRGKPPGGLE